MCACGSSGPSKPKLVHLYRRARHACALEEVSERSVGSPLSKSSSTSLCLPCRVFENIFSNSLGISWEERKDITTEVTQVTGRQVQRQRQTCEVREGQMQGSTPSEEQAALQRERWSTGIKACLSRRSETLVRNKAAPVRSSRPARLKAPRHPRGTFPRRHAGTHADILQVGRKTRRWGLLVGGRRRLEASRTCHR